MDLRAYPWHRIAGGFSIVSALLLAAGYLLGLFNPLPLPNQIINLIALGGFLQLGKRGLIDNDHYTHNEWLVLIFLIVLSYGAIPFMVILMNMGPAG